MAMIDYGSIAFKNGICVQEDVFQDMEKAVGYSSFPLQGNYFSFVGDKDLTFCFYKEHLRVECCVPSYNKIIFFNCCNYEGWKKYRDYVYIHNHLVEYEVVNKRNKTYEFHCEYNGNSYRVVFGYGIDLEFYKRTKRFNYYRSLEFFIHKIYRKLRYGY